MACLAAHPARPCAQRIPAPLQRARQAGCTNGRCSPTRGTPLRSQGGRAAGATGSADVGAAFLEQFKSLSAAQPANATGSSGCCGGSAAGEGAAPEATGSGCCGGGSGSGAQAGATSQLNAMMGGMQGSLSREDMAVAFRASQPAAESADGGERFLDISAVLAGTHRADFADDHDAELDALVV